MNDGGVMVPQHSRHGFKEESGVVGFHSNYTFWGFFLGGGGSLEDNMYYTLFGCVGGCFYLSFLFGVHYMFERIIYVCVSYGELNLFHIIGLLLILGPFLFYICIGLGCWVVCHIFHLQIFFGGGGRGEQQHSSNNCSGRFGDPKNGL